MGSYVILKMIIHFSNKIRIVKWVELYKLIKKIKTYITNKTTQIKNQIKK